MNDSCFLLASGYGAKPGKAHSRGHPGVSRVLRGLERGERPPRAFCIASDEQCVACLITVHVVGALRRGRRRTGVARIGRPFAGGSGPPLPDVMRTGSHIVSSIGYADALFMRERVSVDVMGVPVLRRGALCPFDEQRLLREAGDREIVIRVDLGAGGGANDRTGLAICRRARRPDDGDAGRARDRAVRSAASRTAHARIDGRDGRWIFGDGSKNGWRFSFRFSDPVGVRLLVLQARHHHGSR